MTNILKLPSAVFSWDLGSVLVDLDDGLGRRTLQQVVDEADEDIAVADKIEECVALRRSETSRIAKETTDRSGILQADGHSSSASPAPTEIAEHTARAKSDRVAKEGLAE